MNNGKLTLDKSVWKQASEDLRSFLKKMHCSVQGSGHDCRPILWYYDMDHGLSDYDISSLSITDESFFQKYLNYFMTEFTPKNILPIGVAGDYACFYPELKQILGGKTHILHEDLSKPWCVRIEQSYLLSKDIFELLSKYVVEYLNKVSMFEITVEKIEGIPCLVTFAEIKRICNAEQFFEWIHLYNNLIKNEGNEFQNITIYDTMPGDSIEDFDLHAEWKGDDSELKKLPLFVDVLRKEWEDVHGYNYLGEVKCQMKVSIDDDSKIHVRPDKREICKNYYEKVRSAMNKVNFRARKDGVLYEGVYDDLEYYVQYLIDNKHEHNNTRFISIIHWNELSAFDSLSAEAIYEMQCCILVGVEQI